MFKLDDQLNENYVWVIKNKFIFKINKSKLGIIVQIYTLIKIINQIIAA